MSTKERFLVELDREINNAKGIVNRLKDEDLSFRPHEKSLPLGSFIGYIVDLHNCISDALTTNDFNLTTDFKSLPPSEKECC